MSKLINKENVYKYITIFLLAQPIIDLITSLGIRFFAVDISCGMIIRTAFMALGVIYLLFCSKSSNRKQSLIYLGLIAIYLILYVTNIVSLRGMDALFGEIKILLKLFYFPILLAIFWNLFDEHKFEVKPQTLTKITYLYVGIILLAQLTGTQFLSYGGGKLGHVGWFYSPNEIGAILAMMAPLLIWNIINNRGKAIYYLLLFAYIYSTFIIGTKVPFLGMALSITGVMMIYLLRIMIEKHKRKENTLILIVPLIIALTIVIFMIPNTPAGYNLKLHLGWLKINKIEELYKADKKTELTNFVFSSRDLYLNSTLDEYSKQGIRGKLLGIGYFDENGKTMKLIERDYHDILFRNGIIGFILYFYMFIVIFLNILTKVVLNIRKVISNTELIAYGLGLCLILAIAFFAGHVFLAPSVSIYVVLLTLMLYKKTESL